MSINLTESSRDRDGERAGNNCLERRPGRTIISPVVVPLLGHGSNPSSPCIAVRRATILPLPGGEGGSFRVPVTLLDILFSPPFPPLPPFTQKLYSRFYTRDQVSQRDESDDNIYFRTEDRTGFTKIFLLYFLFVYFGKIIRTDYLREIGGNSFYDRSLSVIVPLHWDLSLSLFVPLFQAPPVSSILRRLLEFPNFLTRIVRCSVVFSTLYVNVKRTR